MPIPFFSTLGIEFSWLYYRKSKNEYDWISGYSSLLRAAMDEAGFKVYGVGVDEEALEIATTAFSNMEDLRKYYLELLTFVSHYPLVTHRADAVSGGGHIHVAIPKRIINDPVYLLAFLVNVFRDSVNRPYLCWIFNEWANEKSARSWVYPYQRRTSTLTDSRGGFLDLIFEEDPMIPKEWTRKSLVNVFDGVKGYAVRVDGSVDGPYSKPATIEFRFFDAKKSFHEVELHVDFCNAYLKYLDNLTSRGTLIETKVRTPEDIKSLGVGDRGLREFKRLTEEMGLDYDRYRYFVETNYSERKRKGLLL